MDFFCKPELSVLDRRTNHYFTLLFVLQILSAESKGELYYFVNVDKWKCLKKIFIRKDLGTSSHVLSPPPRRLLDY